jgi:putative PIN family toxin of toxin-antitoxin system
MRVVFDTVILVRALISPYSWWGRLLFDHAAAYRLVVSSPLVTEYLEVMRRPELARKYRTVATRDVPAVRNRLATAEVVAIADIPAVARDPDDDKFLATAKAGQVDYLVTEDQDLLVLGAHEGTTIVNAETFLGLLGEEAGDDADGETQ